MRPGRELDTFIAREIFGYNVKVKQKELWEEAPLGDRPLRKYSREIAAAWDVMDKMNITLIPVEDGQWFAMVGQEKRWKSPAAFLEFLQTGNFVESGAAVGTNVPETICYAAMKAVETRARKANPDSRESTAAAEEIRH